MIESIGNILAVCSKNFFGLPVWYKYLSNDTAGGCSEIAFSSIYDLFKVLTAFVEIALRLGVLLAVGFIIYGGVRFSVSQGDPNGLSGARNTIINAVVGLAISLSAALIVSLIARTAFS